MIKAVIFDMDGVLIDAKEWHYESLNRALALVGYNISRHAHLTVYDGLPTKKKLEMLTIEQGLPRGLHGFLNDLKQDFTMELVHTQCKPRFTHEYALSSLRAAGYRLAVCSNSIRSSVEAMMTKSALMPYLEFFLSNQDVSEGKPSPEIYQKAIARLGLEPHECLVCEDNENGIKAATAAGAHLFVVQDVEDVNYAALCRRIQEIDHGA